MGPGAQTRGLYAEADDGLASLGREGEEGLSFRGGASGSHCIGSSGLGDLVILSEL